MSVCSSTYLLQEPFKVANQKWECLFDGRHQSGKSQQSQAVEGTEGYSEHIDRDYRHIERGFNVRWWGFYACQENMKHEKLTHDPYGFTWTSDRRQQGAGLKYTWKEDTGEKH